ncbi:hypothetical protein VNI00_003135 [Paramarasmius palmivorus]|uniref:Uncharacterized protein n=1 Tax=Paramarasmius palmivorus TaxID=297713 RepID=A0AAW0DSD6_9AGAR
MLSSCRFVHSIHSSSSQLPQLRPHPCQPWYRPQPEEPLPRTLDTSSFGSATGSGSAASATSSNTPTGATSTAAIVGGVIGAIVGIAAVCIFVAFLIRRLRKRRDEEDHFSAAQFRRSAALLDDEFATDGRAGQIQRGNSIGSNRGGLGAGGGYGTSLRPPTMIERHMASTPAAPPVSYGYGQQYNQYGQYPDYGDQQQYSFQPGQVVTPMNDSMAYGVATTKRWHAAYDNYTAHGAYVDMNRMPSPPAHVTSPPPATISPPPATASPPLAAAPATTGHYEAQSSALASAQAAAQAGNSQPVQRAPSANAGQKRPDTVVSTIYNPDDAYGGM